MEQEKDLERRVADLEKLIDDIIKNEKTLIELSKRHRFNLQKVAGRIGHIELDIGESRENFDEIDRRFNAIDQHFEVVHSRFSDLDARMDRVDGKLDAILARLPKKGEE